jgi:Zn-dependent peptidase ImmA (M78 family)
MHEGRPVFVDRLVRVDRRDGSSDKQEKEANAFAAELLMPRRFIHDRAEQIVAKQGQVMPDRLVEELADSFDVSSAAMGYRLANLNILDPYPAH